MAWKLQLVTLFLYLFAEAFMYKSRVVNKILGTRSLLKSRYISQTKLVMNSISSVSESNDPVSTKEEKKKSAAKHGSVENTNKNGNSIAATVFVDSRIRTYLNMKNNERKTRILLPATIDEEITTLSLRQKLESRLASLCEQPYVLRILVPEVTVTPIQPDSDEQLRSLLQSAQKNQQLSIQLFVDVAPGKFPPPTVEYLKDLADPLESDTYTVLSFYNFAHVRDAEHLADELRELWLPFSAVGRVYLAAEGINAQMTVPTNVLSNFKQACETHWLLRGVALNTDHKITRAEYLENRPFKALHIRVRDQIVADGWSEPLDWHKSGYEMPPEEWHRELDNPNAVILDCRNSYESDVGRFDNAIALNTTFFRESWPVLDEILEKVPKDAPVMTYCTGGIRCVKINAYIEQKLGFKNVSRLKGGVVSYARELAKWDNEGFTAEMVESKAISSPQASKGNSVSAQGTLETAPASLDPSALWLTESGRRNVSVSKFRGMNYVFDERMGSPVTADLLANCETCGDPNDQFTNCQSDQCHVSLIHTISVK